MEKKPGRHQRYRPSRAFSLSELMVAIGILGIGLLIVAASFPVAIDQARQAVEITNAQLVFEEAVGRLKLDVGAGWAGAGGGQIEEFISHDNSVGADEDQYRLGDDEPTPGPTVDATRVYLLSFDEVDTDVTTRHDYFADFSSGDTSTENNCVYSVDDTYGWVAAVRKLQQPGEEGRTALGLPRYYYKFWIFVVREPTGVSDGTALKLALKRIGAVRIGTGETRRLQLTGTSLPGRGSFLLGDDGQVYKITDAGIAEPTGTPNEETQAVMCDKDVSTIDQHVAFVDANSEVTGARVTRRSPVVAVYETVISYEE